MPIDQIEQRRAIVAARRKLDGAIAEAEGKIADRLEEIRLSLTDHQKATNALHLEARTLRDSVYNPGGPVSEAYGELGGEIAMLNGELRGYDPENETFDACSLTGLPILATDDVLGGDDGEPAILLGAVEVLPEFSADAIAQNGRKAAEEAEAGNI